MRHALSQITYLFAISLCCFLARCAGVEEGEGSVTDGNQPNIVVLLADDLGYGDLSSYGGTTVHTPHLDALAARGVRFTHFYAGSAVCSPSRASLLTGRYPLRYGITRHFSDRTEHLPANATTIPEVLADEGYYNIHIGKWHLGGLRPRDYEARAHGEVANPGPLQHGFDHSLTSIEGAPIRPELIGQKRLYREGGNYMVRNDEKAPDTPEHWTEIKVSEAIRQIDVAGEAGQPFFLNLWFDVPHTPYEPAPEPHLSRYEARGAEGNQLYFRSMVSHLDAQIGRLIDYLDEQGLSENTLIVFTSDNGPAFQGNPGPFRGGKTDLHEGGVRVPAFAVYPPRIPAGQVTASVGHMTDLFPTFAELTDTSTKALGLDGISLWPVLENPSFQPRERALVWQMDVYRNFQNQGPKPLPYANATVVDGRYKLLTMNGKPTELFDLAQDHRELYNILDEQPEVADRLEKQVLDFLGAPRDTSGFVERGVLREDQN